MQLLLLVLLPLDGAAVATKTALKRQLTYLKHHNLVRVVPAAGGEPFRYGIVWNKYARRLEAPGDPEVESS